MVAMSGELTEIHRGTRHLVLRRIGQGGAEDVICKTVPPGHPAAAALVAGLHREHAWLTELRLPGTPRALGLEQLDGQPALVMADAGAQNLESWLRHPLPPHLFLALAVQLTEVLGQL